MTPVCARTTNCAAHAKTTSDTSACLKSPFITSKPPLLTRPISSSARGRGVPARGRKGCECPRREIGRPARVEVCYYSARAGREQDAVAVIARRVEETLHVLRLADDRQPVRRARPQARPTLFARERRDAR